MAKRRHPHTGEEIDEPDIPEAQPAHGHGHEKAEKEKPRRDPNDTVDPPHETEKEKDRREQIQKGNLSKPDFSDPDNPRWGATPKEMVKLLKAADSPAETCSLLNQWIVEDDKATIDMLLEQLFRKHPSYDGTIRKAYRILAGDDERIVDNAMKKLYDKIIAENAALEPIMGVTRVQ